MTVFHPPYPDPIDMPAAGGLEMQNYLVEAGVPRQRSRPRYGSKWSRFLKRFRII